MLESIDMDSYRVEKQAVQAVQLADADAQIGPVPADGCGRRPESELDRLSTIISSSNELFGSCDWSDRDRVQWIITQEIPSRVSADVAYQNAQAHSDKGAARLEHDRALGRVIMGLMKDDATLFNQYSDNPDFKRWLADSVFTATYTRPESPGSPYN